jgi:hypothetical protein
VGHFSMLNWYTFRLTKTAFTGVKYPQIKGTEIIWVTRASILIINGILLNGAVTIYGSFSSCAFFLIR